MKVEYRHALASSAILLSLLACRPVFAIGWTELFILAVIIIILFGPFLLRVYRTLEKIRKAEEKQKQESNK